VLQLPAPNLACRKDRPDVGAALTARRANEPILYIPEPYAAWWDESAPSFRSVM